MDDDENTTIVARGDLNETLNRLEARVHGLSKLIETLIQEQGGENTTDELFFKCSCSKNLTYYCNAIFRQNSLLFTTCYVLLLLGLLCLFQAFYIDFSTLKIILAIFTTITILIILVMCLVSVEQIIRLIHRTAKLKTMVVLYLSLVFLYGLVYTFYEIMDPGQFNGIDTTYYAGILRPLQMYVDFIYFSNVCQASVGFGDVSPKTGYGRLTAFTQSIISVGFLSILFSNWIS